MAKDNRGWHGESDRHSLAAKGIKSGTRTSKQMRSDAKRIVNNPPDPLRVEKLEAHAYGFNEGKDIILFDEDTGDKISADEAASEYLEYISQTAFYSNELLPELK